MRMIRMLFLLFLCLVLAAVLLRHAGLERLAPVLLAKAGVNQVRLDLKALDHHHIDIASLALVLPHPGGPVSIRVSDAVCRYHLSGLLRGRVASCTVGAIDVHLPELNGTATSAASTDLPELDKLLRTIDFSRIPVQELHLSRLVVHPSPAKSGNPLVFSLDYTSTPKEHHLFFRPAGPEQSPPFNLELHHDGTGLAATLAVDLARTRGLLPPAYVGNLPSAGQLTGKVRSPPAGPLQLQIDLSGLRHPLLSVGKASLQLESNGPLQDNALQWSPSSQLTINNLRCRGTSLGTFSLNLAGSLRMGNDRWSWHLLPALPCTLDGLAAGKNRFAPLWLKDMDLQLVLDHDQLQLDATLTSPLGNGPIFARCSYRCDPTGTGTCLLQTPRPLILNPAQNPLNLLAAPPKIQILQGKLAFSLEGQWQAQRPLQLRADLDATIQQGSLMDIPFSGLQVQQQVQILPQLQSIKNGRLQLASVEGPVPMQDLTLATRIRPDRRSRQPIVTLEQGKMRLLDGVLRLPQQCTYALDGTPTTCLVQLDGINLESLIALHQVEGLTVSGRVRGRLPLHFSAQGLRIEHGILENEAKGGIIRYQPPTGAMQNSPLTAYALAALRDLHYQHLAAQVDYQPDGTLAVALQVRGSNPGLDNGRPVHLNLNTEQNLLSLLKSLQYSQSLSSELGRKLIKSPSP